MADTDCDGTCDATGEGKRHTARPCGIGQVKVDEVLISDQSLDSLSDRQREVLCLVARGFRVRDVAEKLGISERSADAHKTKAMYRLNIHDRIGVLFYAIQQGLIELEWRDTDSSTPGREARPTGEGSHRRPPSDVDGSSVS